jgi:hypothetical protein
MNELQEALLRRESFQNTYQFVMITGKLLASAREADRETAEELERAALIMLRFVLDSNDRVTTLKGQKRVIRALMSGQLAESALLALRKDQRLRISAGASLEALERAMRALRDEVL